MALSYLKQYIYGNKDAIALFEKELEQSKMPHAYIFEGKEGSGKETFVRSLLADMANDRRNSKLILEGSAPDIITVEIEEGKKTLGVDSVRLIRESAFIKPNDLDFKAYIIPEGDAMTSQAQNALLKLLEEPPKNVYFFILCENSSSLLATVRSRAPVMRMQLFSPQELTDYFMSKEGSGNLLAGLSSDEREHILCLSGGCIGNVINLCGSEKKEGDGMSPDVLEILEFLALKKKTDFFLKFNSLPAKRQELTEFLNVFCFAVRDCILSKQRGEKELLFGYFDKTAALSKKLTMSQLLACYSEAKNAENELQMNLNVSSVKTVLSQKLWKIVG